MRTLTILSLSTTLLLSAAACDGSTSGSSAAPTVSTGLSQEASLNELSDDEVTQICEANREAAAQAAAMVNPCMAIGMMTLAFGGDAASCEAAVEECEGAANGSDFAFEEESSAACDASYRDSLGTECTATVAEYEACGNATLAAQYELAQDMSCAMDVSDAMNMDSENEPPKPQECVVLEEKGCQLGE